MKDLRFRPTKSKTLPLATRSSIELLPLGTNIYFHHRAGVARMMPLDRDRSEPRGWKIVEGTYKKEWVKEPEDGNFGGHAVREQFFDWPQAVGRYPPTRRNKTVMVWPDEGFGFVIGVIRRSIGTSTKSSSYSTMDGWDFEAGYHDSDMYVDLYVIKQFYEGTEYILCPLWAVREVADE